jgi:large subunit ribosomal protein L15
MQIHNISSFIKRKKRIGRGGKRGSYSGRGMKGQKSRAGHKIRPALRDIVLKFPKKRGIGNVRVKKENIFEVNLLNIDKKFNAGEKVDLESLKNKKIINIPKKIKNPKVKILGKGNLNKSLIFDASLSFSEKAKSKIEKSNSKIQ